MLPAVVQQTVYEGWPSKVYCPLQGRSAGTRNDMLDLYDIQDTLGKVKGSLEEGVLIWQTAITWLQV